MTRKKPSSGNSQKIQSNGGGVKHTENYDDTVAVEYYHPVCHLINGERLFYIVIRANDGMQNVRVDIERILNRENLNNSACAYVLFGDQDFLVRCWGDDEHIARVTGLLKSIPGVSNCVVHLIDRIHTWYQLRMRYEIERHHHLNHEYQTSESATDGPLPFTPTLVLDTKTRNKLLARDERYLGLNRRHNHAALPSVAAVKFPEHSTKPLSGKDFHCRVLRSDNNIRFFIFGKTSAGEGRELFRLLQEKLLPARSDESDSSVEDPLRDLLARFCNVSLYTFRERRKMGLILKAETEYVKEWSTLVLSLSNALKDHGIEESTTYICADPIVEEHSLRRYDEVLPTNPRKFYIVQGLLMSQDCRPSDMDPQRNRGRAYRASRFAEIVYQNYFSLLQPGPFWQDHLDDLRYLYRMVAFHEEEKLLAFIMRKFASIEHEICCSLGDQYQQLCERDFQLRLEWLQKKIEGYNKARRAEDSQVLEVSPDAPLPKHVEDVLDAVGALRKARESNKSTMADFFHLVKDAEKRLKIPSSAYKKAREDNEKKQLAIDQSLDELHRLVKRVDPFLKLLENFGAAIIKAGRCRNAVMHGRASNMFATTESGEAYVFEEFLETIIELSLTYKPAIRLLTGTVLGDIQIRFEKKMEVLQKAINAAKQADPAAEVQPRKSPMPK